MHKKETSLSPDCLDDIYDDKDDDIDMIDDSTFITLCIVGIVLLGTVAYKIAGG